MSQQYSLTNPTLRPHPKFDAHSDVQIITRAASDPPDKDALIEVLCHRTSDQRLAIFQIYLETTGRHLSDDMDKLFSFDLYILMAGVSEPYYAYLARCIKRGVPYKWLPMILFTLTNDELNQMKSFFATKYDRDISEYVKKRIRYANKKSQEKFFMKPLMNLLEGRRQENVIVSPEEVNYDVSRLVDMKPGCCGLKTTDKDVIRSILYNKSWGHIRAVCEDYHQRLNKPIFDLVEGANYSYVSQVFCDIVKYALDKNFYFAHLLKLSMKGLGTDDMLLTHIIVKRCEIDLGDIRNEFESVNTQSLRDWVRDDTSGYFQKGLFALMGEQ